MGNKAVTDEKHLISDDADDKEQILDAIRTGCVDAFVVEDHEGHAVYTLQNADLPYSTLVHQMQQGAAMLNPRGEMIYCNPSMAKLLGATAQSMIGVPLQRLVQPEDCANCSDSSRMRRLALARENCGSASPMALFFLPDFPSPPLPAINP